MQHFVLHWVRGTRQRFADQWLRDSGHLRTRASGIVQSA